MPTRLLAIGDIHLGRLSGRLPGGLDPAELGPDAALRAAVRVALEREVTAVLLAGDVADTTRDLFHALGSLAAALAPLTRAGVPVYAVAGNHDHAVLPRLAAQLPDLHLLGAGGRWEQVTLEGPGGPVRLVGWSFPDRHHRASPARDLPRLDAGPPALGLLHADLGATASAYAPVTVGELRAAGEVRWLLGHVHQPSLRPDDDQPGYLGSLQGLDPGETGARGPWLITVAGQDVALEHLPLAPLRWEVRPLDVTAMAEPGLELPEQAFAALATLAAELDAAGDAATAVGVRLRLTGRAAAPAALAAAARELLATGRTVTTGARQLFLDQVTLDVEPAHDLDALAGRHDPPGLLARTLLAVRDGAGEALIADAARTLQEVDRATNFQRLGTPPPDPQAIRHQLLQNGYQLLSTLLAHREDGHGAA